MWFLEKADIILFHFFLRARLSADSHTVGVNAGNIFVLLYIVSLNSDIISKDEFCKWSNE